MKSIITLLAAVVLFSGCQLYKVSSTKDGKVDGIPFLSKKAIVEQKTTYVLPFYDVSASLAAHKIVGKDTTTQIHLFPNARVSPGSDVLHELRRLTVRSKIWEKEDLEAFLQQYQKLLDEPFEANSSLANPVGNTQQRKVVIDETRTYFLNGRTSWFGSSELDFELNADNTLTKSSTSQATDISGLLTAWIPGSAIISKALNLTDEAEVEVEERLFMPGPVTIYEVKLELKGGAWQYDFTREHDTYETDRSPITFDPEKYNYTRTLLPAAAKKESEKKEEESGIKIEGRVTWPPGSQEN